MKHVLQVGKLVAWGTVIALCGLSLLANFRSIQSADQTDGGLALQLPAFLKPAYAADTTPVDFSFLLKEAGITAYTKLDEPLDLTTMEPLFKTIGRQTDEFISGIVVVPDYENLSELGEKSEVQVFLHKDGWIVAYLTKWQRASEIFDWVHYDEKRLKDSTLIENMVRTIAKEAEIPDVAVSYYDFRNPEATNLLLAAIHVDSTKAYAAFEMNIPLKLAVYESTWSQSTFNAPVAVCALDGQRLNTFDFAQWSLATGELLKDKFAQGKTHKFDISLNPSDPSNRNFCGLAVVYKEVTK